MSTKGLVTCMQFLIGYLQAKSAVKKYLKDSNYTLNIELREEPSDPSGGLNELNYPEASKYGPIFTYHSLSGLTSISMGFNKDVLPSSTVEDLQSSLGYVALDKLPMPGFRYPNGWDIYPMTPMSSFKDGVEIISYQNGRIHFKVDTSFFAVYGIMRDLKIPADASAPRNTYFKVRRNIHGLIDVNMPLLLTSLSS